MRFGRGKKRLCYNLKASCKMEPDCDTWSWKVWEGCRDWSCVFKQQWDLSSSGAAREQPTDERICGQKTTGFLAKRLLLLEPNVYCLSSQQSIACLAKRPTLQLPKKKADATLAKRLLCPRSKGCLHILTKCLFKPKDNCLPCWRTIFTLATKDYSLLCQNTTKELSFSKPNDFRVWNQKTLPFPSKVCRPEPTKATFQLRVHCIPTQNTLPFPPKPCHLFTSGIKFVLLYLLIMPVCWKSLALSMKPPIWMAIIVFFTVSLPLWENVLHHADMLFLNERRAMGAISRTIIQSLTPNMEIVGWAPPHKTGPEHVCAISPPHPLRCELQEVSEGTLHS